MNIHLLSQLHGKTAGNLVRETAQVFQYKKKRKHEFWILSCYVDFDLLESYLAELLQDLRITDVYLAFNFGEVYKFGAVYCKDKLNSIHHNLECLGVNFEWKALASSKLVHSKGYSIIQRTADGITAGLVLTTSANFTVPGFNGGNIELGYLSTKKKDLRDFESLYDSLWDDIGVDIDSAVCKQEGYLFKYALLASGVFLHKWSGSMSQQIGIKYELTQKAKERGSIAPALAAVGFAAGDTFTRQVLDMENLPEKEVPSSFIKRFTIETYWGRWCPLEAWDTISASFEGAELFIKKFKAATEDAILDVIKLEALAVQKELIEGRLIKEVGCDHIERWVDKVKNMRNHHRRLERFFVGYEAHDCPYTVENKAEIVDLFESLKEAVDLSKSKNIVMQKIMSSIDSNNPNLIRLNRNEIKIIEDM